MRYKPQSPLEADNTVRYRFGLPVRKMARTIPYGYIEADNGWLEPDEKVFNAVQQAWQYLKENCSQRATLNWLQTETGIPLNLSAFQKIMQSRPPFKCCWKKSREERQKLYEELTSGKAITSITEDESESNS